MLADADCSFSAVVAILVHRIPGFLWSAYTDCTLQANPCGTIKVTLQGLQSDQIDCG